MNIQNKLAKARTNNTHLLSEMKTINNIMLPSTKAKKIILIICSTVILFPLTFGQIMEYPYRDASSIGVLMATGTCLTIVIILFRAERKPDISRMKTLPVALMMLTGFGIVVAFMHHNTGWSYLIMALDMIVFFPLLYLIETDRRDYRCIMKSFALPIMIATVTMFALCIYKMVIGESLFDGTRYFGPLTNPNILSMIGTYGFICSLYMAHSSRRSIPQILTFGFSAGCGLAIAFLGASRTSALILAGCILIEIIFLIKLCRCSCPHPDKSIEASDTKNLRGKNAVIAFILTASLMLIPAGYVRTTPGIQRIGSMDEELANGRVDGMLERFHRNGESLDTYSNGRLDIWRIYFENLTISGGDPDVIEREVLRTHHNANAHNTYLTVAYACGIPTGIVYFLWVLCIGICGIKFVFGKRYTLPEYIFAAMIIYSFAVESMLDIAVFPFWSLPICLFSFCIAPAFERGAGQDFKNTLKQT